MLLTFLNILATIIGVISLLIVTYGVFVGFIAFLRNEFKRINGTYTINNVRQLRADFGSYLLLGISNCIRHTKDRSRPDFRRTGYFRRCSYSKNCIISLSE